MRMPEINAFRSFKIPKLDLTKSFDMKSMDFLLPSKRDGSGGLSTSEDSPKPTYVLAPDTIKMVMMATATTTDKQPLKQPTTKSSELKPVDNDNDNNVISMENQESKMPKVKKIITAMPLNNQGIINGHIVIEDYPYGRKQMGPLDDGGESEIGCDILDQIIRQQQQQQQQ
ncbi:hypothetical protein BLA29_011999, partial [Euroglyphus maynei]